MRLHDVEQHHRLDRLREAERRRLCRPPTASCWPPIVFLKLNTSRSTLYCVAPWRTGEAGGIELLHAADDDADEEVRGVAAFLRRVDVHLAPEERRRSWMQAGPRAALIDHEAGGEELERRGVGARTGDGGAVGVRNIQIGRLAAGGGQGSRRDTAPSSERAHRIHAPVGARLKS